MHGIAHGPCSEELMKKQIVQDLSPKLPEKQMSLRGIEPRLQP